MRMILIDAHTGFIWGESTSSDAKSAAGELDQSNFVSAEYEETGIRDECAVYHIYAVPVGFPAIDDGQDGDMIKNVLKDGHYVTSLLRKQDDVF